MPQKLTVEAELRLKAEKGVRSIEAARSRIQALQSALQGAQMGSGGLVSSLAGFAAGYVGIQAMIGGFRRLTESAVQYQSGLEATSIGLSSVISAVEEIPFDQARAQSQELFNQIQDDAIQSVATSQQLFDIFQSIYGPLRNAGLATGDIRQTMLDTVSAATALNIDLPQASRDIQSMARGAAGLDVRLFSMLRSTGAIAQDAEAFNRLSQPERIEVMRSALQRFSSASEAFGQSFAGVTSTFTDVVQNLTSSFFGPTFREFTAFLGRVNEMLIGSRDQLRGSLQSAGERVAEVMRGVFARIESGVAWLVANFDPLMDKARDFVSKLMEAIPQILKAAAAFAGIQLAIGGFAKVLGIISGVMGFIGPLVQLAGMFTGGGAAAGTAVGAEAAGGAAAVGGMEALGAVWASLSALAGPLAAALAAVAGAALIVYQRFDAFVDMFNSLRPVLGAIAEDLAVSLFATLKALEPLLTIVGGLLMSAFVPFVALMLAFLAALRVVAATLRVVMTIIAGFAQLIHRSIVEPFRDAMLSVAQSIMSVFGVLAGRINLAETAVKNRRAAAGPDPLAGMEQQALSAQAGFQSYRTFGAQAPRIPADRRPVQHNDFRGSRITVNQEFRQADPDRIALQMIQDINRQAEARIQSGFVPALTR